jgi:hypothetical protein
LEACWSARQAVPTPMPIWSAMCCHDAPVARSEAIWAAFLTVDTHSRRLTPLHECSLELKEGYAIAKTIENLRGIERWGASDMMERAFTGFLALPEKASEPWRGVLGFGVNDHLTLAIVESRFRELVRKWHPDVDGGDRDTFEAITGAREQASNELVA